MADNGQLPPSALAPIAGGQLAKPAAAAWNAMNVEARRLHELVLRPTGSLSSYRTLDQQKALYELYLSGKGNLAARPGTSNHGWGLAVDLATPQMRALVDRIGERYGWAKKWSDAPSEWWHLKYAAGKYAGPDPGPYGQPVAKAKPKHEEGDMITAVVKKNGAIEVFVEKQNGEVFHTWQPKENGPWWGAEKGKNAGWQSLGTPK